MTLSTCWSVEQAAWERPGTETPCQESRPGTELLIHVVYAQKASRCSQDLSIQRPTLHGMSRFERHVFL